MDYPQIDDDLSEGDIREALKEIKEYIDITESDLKKIYTIARRYARERLAAKISVGDLMTTNVISISKDTNIREVARILSENYISGMPVIDNNNHVLGVITESDILCMAGMGKHHTFKDVLRHILGEPLPRHQKTDRAEDAMSSPAITTKMDTDIREAARIMDERRVKRLPVVDNDNRLLGIMSRADIVRFIGKK